MDRIRNKYNPEASQLKAERCLTGITKGEFQGWLEHPCTQALKLQIEAGLDTLVLNWVKGAFVTTSCDSTAISQARAAGQTEALEGIMMSIDTLLEITQSEEVYE